MNESPILTVKEAGQLLRLSRGATYEAVRRGDIPTIRIGRRLLVPRARLMAILQEPQPFRPPVPMGSSEKEALGRPYASEDGGRMKSIWYWLFGKPFVIPPWFPFTRPEPPEVAAYWAMKEIEE